MRFERCSSRVLWAVTRRSAPAAEALTDAHWSESNTYEGRLRGGLNADGWSVREEMWSSCWIRQLFDAESERWVEECDRGPWEKMYRDRGTALIALDFNAHLRREKLEEKTPPSPAVRELGACTGLRCASRLYPGLTLIIQVWCEFECIYGRCSTRAFTVISLFQLSYKWRFCTSGWTHTKSGLMIFPYRSIRRGIPGHGTFSPLNRRTLSAPRELNQESVSCKNVQCSPNQNKPNVLITRTELLCLLHVTHLLLSLIYTRPAQAAVWRDSKKSGKKEKQKEKDRENNQQLKIKEKQKLWIIWEERIEET